MKYDPIIRGFPHILNGSDYNPEQWLGTKEIWLEDMRMAGLAHINSLSVGIFSWAALEPREGCYDFSWLDEIMDLLDKNGIKAVLATPSGARPAWLSQKYPEVLRVGADRRRILYGERHNHARRRVYRAKTPPSMSSSSDTGLIRPRVWHLERIRRVATASCAGVSGLAPDPLRVLDDLTRRGDRFLSHTEPDRAPSPLGDNSIHGRRSWKRFVPNRRPTLWPPRWNR